MIRLLARVFWGAAAQRGRRIAIGMGIGVLAAMLFVLSLGGALMALFWVLAQWMPQWQAALLLCGLLLGTSLMLWAISRSMVLAPEAVAPSAGEDLASVISQELAAAKGQAGAGNGTNLVLIAAIAGLVIGKLIAK